MLCHSIKWLFRSAGIIGLPNVGKSTLFNALTCTQNAKTGNYPFCTIDANISKACVWDNRLDRLAKFSGATKIVYVQIQLADVAGLIEGASQGAGLGNKFLADIRPCRVLLHTVRCFQDSSNGFDQPHPLQNIKVIQNELVLADLQFIEKRLHKLRKSRKADNAQLLFAEKVFQHLNSGLGANRVKYSKKNMQTQRLFLTSYELLSSKPTIYVLNVDENSAKNGNAFSNQVQQIYNIDETNMCCRVSIALEQQISQMSSRQQRLLFLSQYGVQSPQSQQLLKRIMQLLKLQTFFTVGPQMAYGWLVKEGSNIRQAAGLIHSDFAKNFIKGHVISWEDMLSCSNLQNAERQMLSVGQNYIIKDGDVVIIDHNCSK